MKSQLACVLRITDIGTRITNCDVIDIRNIITSEGTIREIKRSPDTMKAAAILVNFLTTNLLSRHYIAEYATFDLLISSIFYRHQLTSRCPFNQFTPRLLAGVSPVSKGRFPAISKWASLFGLYHRPYENCSQAVQAVIVANLLHLGNHGK